MNITGVVKNLYENREAFLTLVFTVLMDEDQPADALGYSGAKGQIADDLIAGGKIIQTPQSVNTSLLDAEAQNKYPCQYIDTKDNNTVKLSDYDKVPKEYKSSSKSLLCVDHSAMKIPSEEMMKWVYKGTLFGELVKGAAFENFGHYKIKDVIQKNMADINGGNTETKGGSREKV
jgi:hypothetical protein